MKKIIAAWIEQIIEFPNEDGYLDYMKELNNNGKKYKQVKYEKLPSGVVRLRIRKQYNNNAFLEVRRW